MTIKVIFNTDKKLKDAAMKKARSQGMTLSAFLNFATRAYVNDSIRVDVLGEAIAQSRAEKGIPAKEAYRMLGIKK